MISAALDGRANPPVVPEKLTGTPTQRALLAYVLASLGAELPGLSAALEARAGGAAGTALYALALERLGRATGHFRKLIDNQLETGQFVPQDPYASPDLHWFDELVLLHALASYAAVYSGAEYEGALRSAVDFHARETQPDHATNHPWALHAFARTEDGIVTAGMLLHANQSQNAGRLDPVAQILVADAVLAMK